MRVAATIEARMTSSRLPGKVLADIGGLPALELMVTRLRQVKALDTIVLCTTTNADDAPLESLAERLGIACWRGSEDDVLVRVLDGARAFGVDVIVETTGDCPFIDPAVVSQVIAAYQESPVDYCANILERTWPIGMDTQVFATDVLADVAKRTQDPTDHEHVSLYIYRHPEIYSLRNVPAPPELHAPKLRLTLDTREDLSALQAIAEGLSSRYPSFSLGEILDFLRSHPEIEALNAHVPHRWV